MSVVRSDPVVSGGGGGADSDEGSGTADTGYKDPVVILDSNTLEVAFSALFVADLNVDGYDDFIGTRTTGLQTGPAAELLIMLNDGSGSLMDETASFIDGVIPSYFVTRDIHVFDFNGDNRPYIFLSNQGKEPPSGPATWPCEQNAVLLSQPDGRLKDVSLTNLPVKADFSHGSSVGDIDKDGDLDIWVNNLGCGVTIRSYLLQNNGDVFTEIASLDSPNGILPDTGFNLTFWSKFLDYDTDGAKGLFSTNLADAKPGVQPDR